MNFCNEFKRIFLHQWYSKNKWAMFLFPAVVAVLIFVAFLQRELPAKEYVIFFTTLYAFWLGLFATCQLVNGELENGEWRYWVLGFKRPFLKHLLSLVSSSLVITFLQLLVLISCLCALDIISGKNFLEEIYINTSNLDNSEIEIILFNLPKFFAGLTFAISVFFAGLSGVAIGTLFSTMFREATNSLIFAISFIVIVLISSYIVLKDSNESKFYPVYISAKTDISFSALINNEENRNKAKYEHFKIKDTDKKRKLKKIPEHSINKGYLFLEDLSYIFPQRYFYNLGRIFDKENGIKDKAEKDKIKGNLAILRRLYIKVAFWEAVVLLAYFFLWIFIAYLIIKISRKYYELR